MKLEIKIITLVALLGVLMLHGPQSALVQCSFFDGIPILSQIKSGFQALTGDTEGAKKTQENFIKQAPVVSQITSAVQAATGDTEGAKKTQEQFLHETIEPVAENTPVLGHIVGAGHLAAGNKERGEQIMKGASTSTAALVGGILGGPAGAIAAGAAMDGVVTGIDSAVHGEFRPHGVVEYGDKAAKGELESGDHFDFIAGIGTEFAGGKVANGKGGKSKGKGGGGGIDSEPRLKGDLDGDGQQRYGSGSGSGDAIIDLSGLDKQKIPRDPTDGAHNIETGKKWKSPQEMSASEFGRTLSEMEAGKLDKDFYHVDHWPEPYKSKLQTELSKLSPEHKKRIAGRDLKMIVNNEYKTFNCYYCSIARTVGLTVKEMELRTGIKVQTTGGTMPHILDISERIGLKPNHVIQRASPAEFQVRLESLVGKNQHKRFLIAYDWAGGGAHMTNFEAWRTADGKLWQLHKDFQQPSVHHLDREVSPHSRFYANMPANARNIHLIEVTPDLADAGSKRRRRRRRSALDLESERAATGLPSELAAKLQASDFDTVLDADRGADPSGELSSIASAKGMTISELVKTLEPSFASRAPSSEPIRELYKQMGFDDVSISKPMRAPEFLAYLDRKLVSPGESTRFTLMYWPRGLGRMRFLAAKAWKAPSGGHLQLMTTDHSKESGSGERFSDRLPDDALWLYAATVYNAREIDSYGEGRLTQEQSELMAKIKQQAGGAGDKCGGERIIGYVANWAERPFRIEQAARLTNAIYSFVEMDSSGRLALPASRIARERLVDMVLAREAHRNVGLKFEVSFAVGGWANSAHFSSILGAANTRRAFIGEIERIMRTYQLDGVDIDWEYPGTGGATEGTKADRANYVEFLRELRQQLGTGKLISIAAAAGQEAFEGFDVAQLIKHVDWIGVMTYDFFGAWESKWGAYVGPLASLRHGAPPGYSGKLNVDWAMKQYACLSGASQTHKLVMGLPFYGRFWFKTRPNEKHGDKYPLFRMAERLGGSNNSFGGEAGYRKLVEEWKLNDESGAYTKKWDERSVTPWATDGNLVLTYENERSLGAKVEYAREKHLGGVMIWAVDHDDADGSLLRTVFDRACNKLASGATGQLNYKCNPLGTEKRWWTWLEDKEKGGQCGVDAPLYKGYYPRCDPDDPGYSCCSPHGYCGSGDDFCKCDGCIDYGSNPDLLLAEPTKPSGSAIKWHVGFDLAKSGDPRCGPLAAKLADGGEPGCNPDGRNHCCSPWGFCGFGDSFCTCKGCVDSRKK